MYMYNSAKYNTYLALEEQKEFQSSPQTPAKCPPRLPRRTLSGCIPLWGHMFSSKRTLKACLRFSYFTLHKITIAMKKKRIKFVVYSGNSFPTVQFSVTFDKYLKSQTANAKR